MKSIAISTALRTSGLVTLAWGAFSFIAGASPENPDYYRDVYPFLKANCISCHNKTTTKAGLNMETPELMRKGGDSGPSIIPGDAEASLIVAASLHLDDLEMPPKKNKTDAVNLSPPQIAILKTWINQGAKSSVQEERKVTWQPLAPGVHPIYSVAMTEDGRFAACGRSNRLSLYDLATRRFVTTISDPGLGHGEAHRALVHSLAFSPDGSRLASGGFREVKIWRKKESPGLTRPADPSIGAVAADVSPESSAMICANRDGALLLLDIASGKEIRKIENAASSGVRALKISPDGKAAAVLTEDGQLSAWSLADDRCLSPAGEEIDLLSWCGDGRRLVATGKDGNLFLWDLSKPESPPTEWKGSPGKTLHLATGAELVATAGADNKVRIWNIPQAKVTGEIAAPGVSCLAVSPDGKRIAAGTAKGAVTVWDVATGKPGPSLKGSPSSARKVADLKWKAARQSLEQSFQKSEIARIEKENKALDVLLKKAKDAVVAMTKKLPATEKAVQPATDAVAVAQKAVDDAKAKIAALPEGESDAALVKALKSAQDKLITEKTKETSAIAAFKAVQSNISDAQTQEKRITATLAANAALLEAARAAAEEAKQQQAAFTSELAAAEKEPAASGSRALSIAFSRDGLRIGAVFADGSLLTWASVSGLPLSEEKASPSDSRGLVSRPDGSFLALGRDASFFSTRKPGDWTLERVIGGENRTDIFSDRVNAVTFSPDGKTLATGGGELSRSGDIHLIRVEDGRILSAWKERHTDAVVSLDFSPDGKLLASGGTDKIAHVTEIATGKPVRLFEGHTHYVTDVSFRADGRVLATAGADGIVNSWDMILGERKKKIAGWKKEVTSLHFIGASNQLVTSAGDNLIRVVGDDGRQVRSISKLPDFMQAAVSTPTGETIVGGGEDSFLRIWDGTNGKEIAAFGMPQD